jgi:DNA polymerase-3 subunit gamma/tau
MATPEAKTPGGEPAYRVLARKYRPATFAELIGQEAMVRTLTNAIAGERVAHAFVLTGVRGVGKTTTARLIARALNCVGRDGAGGPTIDPCGVCEHCRAIAEDRHIDVIEVDAASRSKVEEMRELLDGVRYRPAMARTKVYILDEVHMLSEKAFNALLKTLEEPPAHVTFVFATTEARKIPVTVLSRCQRFDLRRVEASRLAEHFKAVAEREGVEIEPAAIALIAHVADGSVRDGLSLLDQAIALSVGPVQEAEVRAMLGLADRSQSFDLFDRVMAGDCKAALDLLRALYEAGADPAVTIRDLLEITHWLTRLKVAPAAADNPLVAESLRVRGRAMAERLSLPVLARAWQMLLKGLAEVQGAPYPLQAADMVLIRLAHLADLPTPGELVAALEGGGASARAAASAAPIAAPSGAPRAAAVGLAPAAEPAAADAVEPRSFADAVELFAQRKEAILHAHLRTKVHLVSFEPGRIEFRPAEGAPANLAARLAAKLGEWSGRRWIVAVSSEAGQPTLADQAAMAEREATETAARHPLVRAVLLAFPGASIEAVRPAAAAVTDVIEDEEAP